MIAPSKVQLRSELAEVKSLSQQCNLLEIINGVATKTMRDQTGRKTYVRLVPATMRIELFKRVHGHDAGHFGYAKIYPLFSDHFFWHGMATDIRAWLKCCALCQRIKPGAVKRGTHSCKKLLVRSWSAAALICLAHSYCLEKKI